MGLVNLATVVLCAQILCKCVGGTANGFALLAAGEEASSLLAALQHEDVLQAAQGHAAAEVDAVHGEHISKALDCNCTLANVELCHRHVHN